MDTEITWYLAGPMTGIPKFNFPLFIEATAQLRSDGYNIISPAELDDDAGIQEKALACDDGQLDTAGIKETWGDLLARDVKLIADNCGGIAFLPNWHKSRGARLEAYVGLLCGHKFATYMSSGSLAQISSKAVLTKLSRQTYEDIRRVTD